MMKTLYFIWLLHLMLFLQQGKNVTYQTSISLFNFRRIQKANATWKKCGYEERCVFKNGKGYRFENLASNGELNLDISCAFYANVEFKNVYIDYHDFLEISILYDQQVFKK